MSIVEFIGLDVTNESIKKKKERKIEGGSWGESTFKEKGEGEEFSGKLNTWIERSRRISQTGRCL